MTGPPATATVGDEIVLHFENQLHAGVSGFVIPNERAMPELKRLEFRPVRRVRQLKMSHGKVIETRWKQTLQARSRGCKPKKLRH